MIQFTSDQWVIIALVFVLGLLVGGFLFTGGGRKWKSRYREEVSARDKLATDHRDREKHFETREKEWREQDSARAAAIRDRPADDLQPGEERRVADRRGADRRGDDPAI